MLARRFLTFLFCLVVFVPFTLGMTTKEKQEAVSSTPSVGDPSDGLASVDPVPDEKISGSEVRKIRRTFIDVLEHHRDTMRRDQRRSLKEGDAGRKARKKEWLAIETAARRQFFKENVHGPERRDYVHDFSERRKKFFALLKGEERVQKSEIDARWKSLEQDQRMRLKRVESFLKKGKRPPVELLQSP